MLILLLTTLYGALRGLLMVGLGFPQPLLLEATYGIDASKSREEDNQSTTVLLLRLLTTNNHGTPSVAWPY